MTVLPRLSQTGIVKSRTKCQEPFTPARRTDPGAGPSRKRVSGAGSGSLQRDAALAVVRRFAIGVGHLHQPVPRIVGVLILSIIHHISSHVIALVRLGVRILILRHHVAARRGEVIDVGLLAGLERPVPIVIHLDGQSFDGDPAGAGVQTLSVGIDPSTNATP